MKYYIYQMEGMENPVVYEVTSQDRGDLVSPVATFSSDSAENLPELAIAELTLLGIPARSGVQIELRQTVSKDFIV